MSEEAEEVAEIAQQLRGRAHTTAIAALEVVPVAMLITDGGGQALAVNAPWMELSGLGRANSLGPGWLSVLEPDARSRLREDVLRVGRDGGAAAVDYQVGAPPRRRWTRWWISRHELDGLPLIAVAAADVDEDYTRQADLYHLATHDSLTGLINRSHFIECIDQALRRSQRQARHVAVVYVDLDGFKRVNDLGGHALGDRVLFAIASRLRHAVRSADMVARIGGDEFAVLCEGLVATDEADVVAHRIALALTESVELDGERWSVAASVGAAVDRGDPDSAEDLVDRADRAMYSIKSARRGPAAPQSTDLAPPAEHTRPSGPATPADRPQRGHPRSSPADRRSAEPAYETMAGDESAYSAGDDPGYSGGGSNDPGYSAGGSSGSGYRPVGGEGEPAASGAEAAHGRLGVLDPDEARRALRDLAEAAGAFGSATRPAQTAAPPDRDVDPARHRLATDVVNLRESIDSIRRMLDRLLAAETGIIDIRDEPQRLS